VMNASIEGSKKKSEDSVCASMFLTSPKDIDLKIVGVPCNLTQRYLCQRSTKFDSSVCTTLNYTELTEDNYIFSYDEVINRNIV
jgi:hypothetical protein